MATRQDVIDGIATINDGGNNTATEVRDVLGLLLDYTENEEPTTDKPLNFLQFNNDGNFVEDGRGTFLWYSCNCLFNDEGKGDANLTFRIHFKEGDIFNSEFPIKPKFYELLKKLVETDKLLSFVVPLQNPQMASAPITVSLSLKSQNKLGFIFNGRETILKSSEIFTSIQFHSPVFNFDQIG